MVKAKGIIFLTVVIMLMAFSCAGPESDQPLLTAEVPLHLEENLDAARIEGSEVPQDIPKAVEWSFDKPQPDWKPAIPINKTTKPVKVQRTDDALRVILDESNFNPNKQSVGGIYIDLPGWHRGNWAYILVHARTSEQIHDFCIGFNLLEQPETPPLWAWPFSNEGEWVPVITDGTVQTYLIRADYSPGEKREEKWKQLGIWFHALEPAKVDILSVSVLPKEAIYAGAPAGVSTEMRSNSYRRTLYTHVPGRLEYKVRVPKAGRLDVGLGVLWEDVPVTFRIKASLRGGGAETLFEETYANQEEWGERTIDLSSIAGKTVRITLGADAERLGTVALWAVPTISGIRKTKKPNVIFYIIDGAGADYMSVYGYNRRTTPNLERIAAEGAVFERAYSNSSWTRPSTPSFLTSLQHSVFGGLKNGRNPVPEQVLTMAQHMHRAGYQTALLTSQPNAGRMSNLERGVDVFRDFNIGNNSVSSVSLHEDFWQWRKAYPAEPYWVHFQTTDVHWEHTPVPPFAGLFISPERRRIADEWLERLLQGPIKGGDAGVVRALKKLDIDHVLFFTAQRDLHDETMAHQDYQLGQLVAQLKAAGEWERTLLIIAADHTLAAGALDYNLLIRDSAPPHFAINDPAIPMLRSGVSHIPLIVVWPGKIAGGQRFSQPVSMIDMLPTILDLTDLPMPEVMQGQSLAPLLLGKPGWESRPVILDEFEVDRDTGELRGRIEMIDGRWGASLQINPDPKSKPEQQRPVPLLLYDLWNDPECLHSLHEERPDLVDKYTKFLEAQWKMHQTLAKQFTRPKDSPLTTEQLETLRSLGYIR